ncbi:MAG: hypothetical protein JXR94_23420, partial [Candidatus Hydrogenedentes bacterium]|nr:hypothetical protein [Candidatus Hydrogenedentota bacterium]
AVAIAPRRGGTLLAIRFDAVDEAGAPVFTEYVGAFLRRVRCAGEATGEENLPEVPSFEPDGSPLWEVPIHIDPLAAHVFDGCGGLHFPIHTSKRFARSVGLPRTILQGTATLSLAVRELTNRELDGDPNRLRSLACEFTGLVLPGTPITVRVLGREQTGDTGRLFFDVLNAEEKKAITDGYATYAL